MERRASPTERRTPDRAMPSAMTTWRGQRSASAAATFGNSIIITANGSMARPATTAELPKAFWIYSGKKVIITCAAAA